ncbi:MAG: LysM peptidoglycan-binding domain-containing protein [Clostridia bacterium]|nr:LysM peptidoglycan-binding domain-containing protein [Clostridia bacterium]
MKGIDVSAHQGNINWDAVKASGIEFAIIRISYGQSAVDSKAIRNIEECIRVGMPFGVYVYSYALNVNNAINEANLVIKTLAPYKNKVKFPVIIDMEDADGYKAKHGMPSNDTLVSICEKECLMFEEAGYYAAIYASKSWFDTKLNSSRLNRFDKWMAWWYSQASSKFDHNTYGLWQYTSSGKVNGISGNVDMNESFKDYPSIIGGGNPTPAQPSAPTTNEPTGSTLDLAAAVMRGEYGDLGVRKNNLGNRYNEVQDFINHIYTASIDTLVAETKAGKYGNVPIRSDVLGSRFKEVQDKINGKASNNSSSKTYVVKSGDTLSGIGAKLGVNWKTIADKNGIKAPYTIYPNQVLKY